MPLKSLQALVSPRKKPSQARAQRTLDTLFEATAQVLMQQGEDGFTTNRVAERSGFSIGTLYQYFPNKQSLLRGLIEHERRRSMAQRQQFLSQAKARGMNVYEVLRDYVHASIDEFGSGSPAKRMLVRIAWRNDDHAAFAQALDDMGAFILELLRSLDAPELRPPNEAQVYVLTRAVMGAIRSASLEGSPMLDAPEFKDEMVKLAWGMLKREPDNARMRLTFTKMQGAGNDFVVLDGTRERIELSAEQVRRLGDRRFGVGADQILVVERSSTPGVDFRYRIFNNSGDEVEHCGNGARCFVRFVRDKGLSDKSTIRVETMDRELELRLQPDGRVTVDMGAPVFEHAKIPFDASGLEPETLGGFERWPLSLGDYEVGVAVLSMGNPHAVQVVPDVDTAAVASEGPFIEAHARFPRKVNAGFMQIVNRKHIRLRVFERDAGETLACGTGACAAVVAGIRLGLLDARVDVDARGGRLSIEWNGGTSHVLMTGPAQTVFEGEIEL